MPSEFGYLCGSGYIKYQTKPTDYAGGAKSVRSGAPKASYCIYQQAGSTAHKKITAAFTFSLGFEIPAIGASLSAQTGYDSEGEVTYHFIHQGNLCGTNAYPGQIPKRLVAEHTQADHGQPSGDHHAGGLLVHWIRDKRSTYRRRYTRY